MRGPLSLAVIWVKGLTMIQVTRLELSPAMSQAIRSDVPLAVQREGLGNRAASEARAFVQAKAQMEIILR